jgi:hypothetical protein
MLIESKKPTWLYGTASEHSVLYQYQLYKSKYVHAGMIQTESPYFQPNPLPPYPFADSIGRFNGDPTASCFSSINPGCDAAWSVRLVKSSDISIAGAGLYSWFQTYDQTCVDTRNCQKSLVYLEQNGPGIYLQNVVTIGSEQMFSTGFGEISAKANAAPDAHPYWSHVSLFNVSAERQTAGDDDGEDNDIDIVYYPQDLWSQSAPQIECSPPCSIILPPILIGSSTTISWPPYTTSVYVSSGDSMYIKSTTISIPPVTTDRIHLWPVTVTEHDVTLATVNPMQSVRPPPYLLTLPGSEAPIPPTHYPLPGMTQATTTTTTTNYTLFPVFFPTGSRTITVKPMPTVSVTHPPPYIPLVTYKSQTSKPPTPKQTPICIKDCGSRDCDFGCGKGDCSPFGCDGGCGLLGCGGGGGCGLGGCCRVNCCSLGNCGGHGHITGPPTGSTQPTDHCEGGVCCNTSLNPEMGRCPNGNIPVFKPSSFSIDCSLSDKDAEQVSPNLGN